MTVKTELGTIIASKETLNMLIIGCYEASDKLMKDTAFSLSDKFAVAAHDIHSALDEVGYFDSVKEVEIC